MVTAAIAVAAAAVIAVWFGLSGAGTPTPVKSPTRAKTAAGLQPTVKGVFGGLALDAVRIPVASLPVPAAAFRRTDRPHATVTGFVFRNRKDTSLCLAR